MFHFDCLSQHGPSRLPVHRQRRRFHTDLVGDAAAIAPAGLSLSALHLLDTPVIRAGPKSTNRPPMACAVALESAP